MTPEIPRWKLPSNYEDLFLIATRFDAGPVPIVNGHLWTERHKFIDGDSYRMSVEKRGPAAWAICECGSNLSRYGEWDYEPSNSNKTDDFLNVHRYGTAREALEIADHYRDRITAWAVGSGKDVFNSQDWTGSDEQRIFQALGLAYAAHRGQFRKFSVGEPTPYIEHPASIARQTESWLVGNGKAAFRRVGTVAAWWHDVEEDCDPK